MKDLEGVRDLMTMVEKDRLSVTGKCLVVTDVDGLKRFGRWGDW